MGLFYQNPYYKGEYRITCPFKKTGSWSAGYHIGVDLVGDTSKTLYPIYPGVVQSINDKGSAYGNHILIKQNDGRVALY
ncbi:MAG: peptidase, partial [Clostridia bacterium]